MPPTLGVVTPQEWESRTSLLIGKRSPQLLKVDAAYSAYYKVRSDENKQALYKELAQYLREHGGNWETSDRNKRSGGLMKYIYDSCKPYTGKNVLELRVPEARHGVLYLWQNASVETQWAKIIVQGLLDVGSNTGSMLQASNYNAGDPLGSLGVISSQSNWNTAVTAIGVADTANNAFNGAKGSASFKGASPGAKAPAPVPPSPKGSTTISLNTVQPDPGILATAKKLFGDKLDEIINWIKRKIEQIWNDVQMQWYSGGIWAPIGSAVAGLVNFILGQVCAVAAPFVGSAIAIGQGFAKAFSAGMDRVSAMNKRRHFIIAPGHPQLIGDAIETQMNWDIGSGIYSMAKGGVMLATDIVGSGAGAIVGVVAACVEFAWKFITRLLQGLKMNAWIKEVKSATGNRNAWKADPKDGKWRPSIVYSERDFRTLFENGCNASVCVPMMTLNSGITGDLMMFMKMFDDTGSILGQSTGASLQGPTKEAQKKFNAGEGYWSLMKQKSRNYLEGTGFKFISSDKVAAGLMKHAIEHHTTVSSMAERALAFAAGS
jgi:hypothetical protein